MTLIDHYIDSIFEEMKFTASHEGCRGVISFEEIKKELGRERINSQMIEEYTNMIEKRGIKAEVDNAAKSIFITIEKNADLVLTPTQMKKKNIAIEHYIKNYS